MLNHNDNGKKSFATSRWPALIKLLLAGWLSAVTAAAFVYAPTAKGFVGHSSRIIYFHVPLAWVAVLAFFVSMVASVRYLRRRDLADDALSAASARLGLLFTIMATGSGALFAKLTWRSFWNWDPRETTIVLLLLIYCAYLILRSAVRDPFRRANLSAVYAIFAFVTVPFLVFVAPRLSFSLHPTNNVFDANDGMTFAPPIRNVLLAALMGFTGLYVWLLRLETRIAALYRQKENWDE